MVLRSVALGSDEVPRIAAGLAARGPLAWLDGDGASALGRHSFLALDSAPARVLRGGRVEPAALSRWLDLAPCADEATDLARRAPRATLALSYDLTWALGPALGLRSSPRHRRAEDSLLAFATPHHAVLAVDHATNEAVVVADDEAALARALARLDAARTSELPRATLSRVQPEPRAVHRAAIARVLEEIAAGDLYQVNLARRFDARLDGSALALTLAMRAASPVPLGAHLDGPDGISLIARTMEQFLTFDPHTRRLETRPIKGTRARTMGSDPAITSHLLRSDEKERAEHAMIVDLMRNDLGRVAVPGSVRPAEVMRVEPYAHLSHLVSIVEARARDDLSLGELLVATFPPGSVTGTPKLSAIARIETLERGPRGFYTGAIGSLARNGTLSLAVAIRTAVVEEGAVTYFAGGGIVEASDPDREVDETELKARVLDDARALLSRPIEAAGSA